MKVKNYYSTYSNLLKTPNKKGWYFYDKGTVKRFFKNNKQHCENGIYAEDTSCVSAAMYGICDFRVKKKIAFK